MTFDEVLEQVRELVQSKGRVAYRTLKRRFDLDDEYLDDLKAELIDAEHVARDEDGKVLVWTSGETKGEKAKGAKGERERDSALRTPHSPLLSAERRQLTVMFCDLVGSTALSTQLDPEELREVIRAYRETCATVIRRFDGHLAKYIGDGLLVYFGYPVAHEDDAQRAVRAGLGIVGTMQDMPLQHLQLPHPLQVRIGIHTGLVVAGEMGVGDHPDPLAIVGETPNIAARVQGLAEPNAVVISDATSRLVQGLFECQDQGPQALKGVSTPVAVYRVLRESEAQSRFEVAVRTGLTPLVGRDEELGLLRRRWEQAQAGAGQVVLLSGEPGIGKSRLVQTLKEHVSAAGATRIEFRCSAYHHNSAFYPIVEHLQRLLQFAAHEPPPVKVSKLQQTLARYRFPQADTLPLVAALLSLPQPEGTPPLTLSPQKQKQKTQEALVAWLVEEAEKAAVYCAWEDLHWADPSTLDVLTRLLDQVPTTRLLAVLTFRPEFMPPWGNRSHLSQLTLSRLGRSQVEAMVERVTGGKALPPEVVQQIVVKTDGVPLFVEELTKTVVESGLLTAVDDHYELSGPLPPLAIPSTLHASLLARLDRLSTVREIAQLGATIGREFSYELLQAVSPLNEGTLQQGLKQLVEAELVYQRGLLPQAHYLFKHALIQDTAYQSLLKSTRQQSHRQIAQVLAKRFPETVKTQPELVAHHYTEAGLIEQALPYWQQAGERANQRSAYVEAISHLTRGLELLKLLPDTPKRIQHELDLLVALGPAFIATKGYVSVEVEHTYARARELCGQVEEISQLVPVLLGLRLFYLQRAEFQTAWELGEQVDSLAQRVQDPMLLLAAHQGLGTVLFWRGKLPQAQARLAEGVILYASQQQHALSSLYSAEPGMICLTYTALSLWLLGYPDQALHRSQEALTLARQGSRPFLLAYTLTMVAWLHQFRQEGQYIQEQAEAIMTVSIKEGFQYFLAVGRMFKGWALAKQGQGEKGLAELRQGLATHGTTGTKMGQSYGLALLAEAYGAGGQSEEGLRVLDEALTVVCDTGECMYEAELYRLRGELLLGQTIPDRHQAETCFHRALAIARCQQAKSLELRATMSLSRLWQRQGKRAEVYELLAPIYGWFTEGFDTKDLQEAQALLEELT